jgi:threonine/homoserine/homoserine lactone efflux protein
MNTWSLLLTVASVHALAVIAPGPNFLVVMRNALHAGRLPGFLTVFGVLTGGVIYISAGFLGVSALIEGAPRVYFAMRLVGAVYLIYLGIKVIRNSGTPVTLASTTHTVTPNELPMAYINGLLTNLSNPTSLLYFFTVFTTVIPPDLTLNLRLVVALMMMSITALWYTFVVTSFSLPRVRAAYVQIKRYADYAFGGLLIVLALRVIFT